MLPRGIKSLESGKTRDWHNTVMDLDDNRIENLTGLHVSISSFMQNKSHINPTKRKYYYGNKTDDALSKGVKLRSLTLDSRDERYRANDDNYISLLKHASKLPELRHLEILCRVFSKQILKVVVEMQNLESLHIGCTTFEKGFDFKQLAILPVKTLFVEEANGLVCPKTVRQLCLSIQNVKTAIQFLGTLSGNDQLKKIELYGYTSIREKIHALTSDVVKAVLALPQVKQLALRKVSLKQQAPLKLIAKSNLESVSLIGCSHAADSNLVLACGSVKVHVEETEMAAAATETNEKGERRSTRTLGKRQVVEEQEDEEEANPKTRKRTRK
jgi:hypothetical protein